MRGPSRFDPRNDLVLGSVWIGMSCMNVVSVILRYTWVPVTLSTSIQKKMYHNCYLGLFWLSSGSLSPTSLALSSTDLSPFPWYLDSSSYR